MGRITIDEYYLEIAKSVSLRSSCLIRQYGAVVVKNKEIIATGYNGSPRGTANCCDSCKCKRYGNLNWGDTIHTHNDGKYDECESVHAEMNAIISASRRDMIGATLYLFGSENGKQIDNVEPCPVCRRLIKNAGIHKVVSTNLNEVFN